MVNAAMYPNAQANAAHCYCGFSVPLLMRRQSFSEEEGVQLFNRRTGAESGRSDGTQKVKTQSGVVVNKCNYISLKRKLLF